MEIRSFKTLLWLGTALLLSAASAAGECRPLEVVTSGTIIADIAKNVGGDNVSVHPLIGFGGEMHFYTEKPSDLKLVAKADLILKNCLELDPWLDRLAKASGTRARSVCVTDGITPIKLAAGTDPHAWNSPYSALSYVDGTEKALSAAAPDLAGVFAENAAKYREQISPLLRATGRSSAQYLRSRERRSPAMRHSATLRVTTASISNPYTAPAMMQRKEPAACRRLSVK